jgi:ubiquinone/menaquinone biosynthesis C-methylase UbiE
MIQRAPGDHPRILDVGCGGGYDLEYWLSNGWPADSLAGVDLVESRIAAARKRCPDVDLQVISGVNLPFATGSFDVATAMTVFSSILDATVRRLLFAEMRRVVRPGGSILVYDFVVRKPGNVDVVAMTPRVLRSMAGPPAESISVTPLVHAVALASRLGSFATRVAVALGPRTHRLSRWEPEGPLTKSANGPHRPS